MNLKTTSFNKNKALLLIVKNSFKNIFQKKFLLSGLTILVSLLALVLSLLTSINARVLNGYYSLINTSNLHNVVLELNPTALVPLASADPADETPNNLVEAQQYWLTELQQDYVNSDLAFYWSRTEAREFSQVYMQDLQITTKILAKTTSANAYNGYPDPTPVDSLTIFKGRKMELDHELVMDEIFAKKHNLNLGDIIRIQNDSLGDQLLVINSKNKNNLHNDLLEIQKEGLDKPDGLYQKKYAAHFNWYQIVGFGGSIDFSMPIINSSAVIPNRDKEVLMYVTPENFGLKKAVSTAGERYGLYKSDATDGRLTTSATTELESFYSLKMFKTQYLTDADIDELNANFNTKIKQESRPKRYFYNLGDPNYLFNGRTANLSRTISLYNSWSSALLIVFICVVFYAIGLVMRDQIQKARGQIGFLKALGYNNFQVVLNFTAIPFFTSFIGGIIGFAFTGILSNLIVKKFTEYFILNYGKAHFDWLYFILTIILLWVVVSALSFFIAYFVLHKQTYELISEQKMKTLSRTAMKFKKSFAKKHINEKVRVALFLDARGKMTVLGFVVFATTMMLTNAFAAPDILVRNKIAAFEGINYKQVVDFSEPSYNNPLSFYKTFNVNEQQETDVSDIFKYSKFLDGFTALPLEGGEGKYDIAKIIEAYKTDKVNTEFYSNFLANDSNSSEEQPPAPDFVMSNLRFLTPQNISATTNFYRLLAQYGGSSDFMSPILLQQWPDHVNFVSQLKEPLRNVEEDAEDNRKTALIQSFKDFQKFYGQVSNSISLAISKEFWADGITYKNTDVEKIQSFNKDKEVDQKILEKTYTFLDSSAVLETNPYLKEVQNHPLGAKFELATDENLGLFKIAQPDPNNNENDYYLGVDAQTLYDKEDNEEFWQIFRKFLMWYGAFVANRGDMGITQGAFSRSPYFVQQSLKIAYRTKKTYSMTFGVISYDPTIEHLGTSLNARVGLQRDLDFKIYGIQNQNLEDSSFLNLRNKQEEDLIQKLYNAPVDNEAYNIVINQALAKTLKLHDGDNVDLAIVQRELQEKNESSEPRPFDLEDWEIGTLRSWDTADPEKNGFTQINKDFEYDVKIKTSTGNKLEIKSDDVMGASPGAYYKEILNGNIFLGDRIQDQKFKVVGIHKGYGTQQAWIKEADAQKILEYDKMKAVFWGNWFAKQWGNTFKTYYQPASPDGEMSDFLEDVDFSKKIVNYADFQQKYLNSANPTIKETATEINAIFEKAYPVFNYKYSNKVDIGDLQNVISTYHDYGDYSPVAMNGVLATEYSPSYDGMGRTAIDNIVPIEIAQAMLNQLSSLVMVFLSLGIIIILLITFVIILLTTSLIIGDNINFIATLKILGYSNGYISKTVLGMYFVVIAIAWFFGFLGGWFVFVAVVDSLVPTLVLPLKFPIWLVFAVILGVVGIYGICFGAGFRSIAKTNALQILIHNK